MVKKSNKSLAEIEITAFLSSLDDNFDISFKNKDKFAENGLKLLQRTEELRSSRDKWRTRAETAEKELKRLNSLMESNKK